MATYTGANGIKRYVLDQQLGVGGEGTVYAISGDSSHVAKIYKTDRFNTDAERSTMERKLKAMLSMNISAVVDGLLRLAWPQDILYENGRFVGFVMPRINSKLKIFDIYRDSPVRRREYPNYTWKYAAQLAYNMAWVVNYVHQNNIVIGDLNQNNIAVDTKTGAVILIDCDSFDIRDPKTGEHFPCVVGLPEMLAPELQRVGNLRNGTFTRESDNFSLAIHIFRFLMNNQDPFGGIITNGASVSSISGDMDIIQGNCPYVRNVPNKKLGEWMLKLDSLPPSIQTLFRKTFNYTEMTARSSIAGRATAREWVNALAVLAAAEPNPNLKTCYRNSKHVYPAHNTACPWCAIENKLPVPPPPQPPKPSPTPKPNPGSSGQQHTARINAVPPVRRTATLFYIVLILFGVASGFVFGSLAADMVNSFFDTGMSSGAATVILSLMGLIAGFFMAHHYEDDYTRADNGIGWLFLGLVSLIAPLAISLVLGLAVALVIAVISVVLYLISIVIGLVCVCSMCSGS